MRGAEPPHGAAAASSLPSLDGTRRVYLNQKAVPNFVAPLEEQVGPPPSWVGRDRRALSHLWMGNVPVITGLHTDQFDNIIRVHRGRKSVLLFRPDQRKLLYYEPVLDVYTEYNVSTASARVVSATVSSNHALVGLRDGDGGSAGFPLFEQAAGLGCELGPGDTILIPKLWHHAVASTPDDGWSAPQRFRVLLRFSPDRGGVSGAACMSRRTGGSQSPEDERDLFVQSPTHGPHAHPLLSYERQRASGWVFASLPKSLF